jgi:hypothetical protein
MLHLNDAEDQQFFDLIDEGTIVKVHMDIRPGGYNDKEQGWDGGYAKKNKETGAIYLDCQFTVMEGPYHKRKIWSKIGLHSEKGPNWNNMGKSFMKAIVDSAYGFSRKDKSEKAVTIRNACSFHDLNGIEFTARIDIEVDKQTGKKKNIIQTALTVDDEGYLGSSSGSASLTASSVAAASSHTSSLPSWAK